MKPRFRRHRPGVRRLTTVIAAVVAVAVAVSVQNTSPTLAAWSDSEWVSSAPQALGTVNCDVPEESFASRGEGRVLSGSLLNLDSSTVADITRVLTTNDGAQSRRLPATAAPVSGLDDAYADPLRLALLNETIAIDATSVLQLPLNTDTGLLGQFGQAENTGNSSGAGGYVTDSGNVNFSGANAGYPNLATLKLSTLLNSLGVNLGDLVGGVADVELGIGAVAGRAALVDPCAAYWAGDISAALEREYLAAGLTLGITSPVVSVLGTTVDSTLLTLETTANGLIGQSGLLAGVTMTVVDVVKGVVNTLSLLTGLRVASSGAAAKIASIDIDLGAVRNLVDNPANDPHGVLSVSLRSGTVTIDTAALLAATYPGVYSNGLNGLPPNTDLLADPNVLSTLKTRLLNVLQALVTNIDTTLTHALNNAMITTIVTVPFESCSLLCLGGNWVPSGALSVTVTGTLAQLLAGTVVPTIQVDAVLGGALGTLVGSLLSQVVGLLTGTLGATIGGIVNNVLRPIVTGLLPTLNGLTTPVVTLVSNVYTELFLKELVAITFNAQNDPAPGSLPEPHDWASLQHGQYDVAAIRIGVLDVLNPSAVWLYLGRGSVGTTCSLATAPVNCAGY